MTQEGKICGWSWIKFLPTSKTNVDIFLQQGFKNHGYMIPTGKEILFKVSQVNRIDA
jgi:hypothetical protein